jgi:hypothetical protein
MFPHESVMFAAVYYDTTGRPLRSGWALRTGRSLCSNLKSSHRRTPLVVVEEEGFKLIVPTKIASVKSTESVGMSQRIT